MQQEEHYIQAGIVALLRLYGVLCFAVPNGGRRDKATGGKLKGEGALAGVSDMIIVLPRRVVFVEVKTAKGKQEPSQKEFQRRVESLGFEYLIWRSVDDCNKWIKTAIKT